ncbi:unnamed protein product [Didymodactylos carnosus]|uniref:RING-type E3 ubiquitin transferase n=1 Tax=Didymodactylos carnosus TaxID=1234261 RepID=A0A814XJX3_9BILA|nr:unnamed protein product [Didymodactylos carnosus]CAF1215068.1 unnamed protein product [Didymodactylos carnosus]CAF3653811.1 unnamed protein product [Didymodactylos carnosus]CAF3978913.1 unnamed protein product [Didymodactylos carnosus]
MATSIAPQKELCRYFLSNVCRFGDRCMFSHDRNSAKPNNICRYYLQGKCAYGDQCRYDHVRPKPNTSSHPIILSQTPQIYYSPENDYSDPKLLPLAHSVSKTNGCTSYADILRGVDSLSLANHSNFDIQTQQQPPSSQTVYLSLQSLCPYSEKDGYCEAKEHGGYCPYIHGNLCDLCEMPCLHPYNEKQQEEHRLECMKKHETACEEAFAIQRSQDKVCGICMETVWDKEDGDKRFGILEQCNHVFCLECIRKWRSSSNYEHKVVKACPECRVKSDFVTPAKYWHENDNEKKKIIEDYKAHLQSMHCKHFKRGDGHCPFGSKCFYLHADKQGNPVTLAPPRRRRRLNARGELENFSDVLMVSVFSHEDFGRIFDEYDFLFDDEDSDDNLSDGDPDNDRQNTGVGARDFPWVDDNSFTDEDENGLINFW